LVLRMPSYGGVSVQVQNTPGGATTELYTETNAINDLTVLGTTGPLGLDNVTFASGAEYSAFAAGSLSIGEGDLSAIAGPISVGSASVLGKVTIDDHSDATSRQATFALVPGTSLFGLAGLSPAAIDVYQFASFPEFDIYGAAASTYSFLGGLQNTRFFAGAGSSVELTQSTSSNVIAPLSVFGAATVLIDLKVNPSFQSADTINVAPDPARPADTTDLTVDFTKIPVSGLKLGSVGGGIYALFGNGNSTQAVAYQGATTHLALLLYSQATTNSLPVTDAASGGTTISPGAYALNLQQTSGPLTIDQSGTGAVTLGKSGSLAGIQGAVSVLANSSTLPPVSLALDDSADSASKVVTLSQDASGNTQISGAVVAPIQITGSQFSLALKGGSGTNTLVAPDVVDDWQVSSANSGVLNRTITFSGFGSLQSGSQDDSIFFKPGGSLTGNLDGGPGTDTLYYQAGMLTGSDVINLPAHLAPRVAGQALNIESTSTFSALTITNPGQLSVQVDAPLTPVTIAVSGGSGAETFSATGLPTGVAINPATGVIAGTNTTEFYSATVVVTVTDDTGSASTSFAWTTLPGLILTTPANQSSQVSQVLTLPIPTSYSYGGTLTYTATNLPAGLSINPQTGAISGTIADGAQNGSPYSVSVNATDGTHSATVYFNWTVAKSFVVVNPGTQIFPENLPVYLQMQAVNGSAPYTYSATGLPLSLQIDPNTGLISGTLADYADSSGHYLNFSVTVSATDSTHHTVSTTFTFGTEPGFYMTGVGDQSNRAGDVVDDFIGAFNADQNATLVTSLTGLPPGLTYDSSTHLVTGTIAAGAFTASPYLTTVTVVNQTFNYTYTTTFNWTVTPAIVMANPGDQTSVVGTVVNLPIVVTQSFGQPVIFSASSELPLGLTLDPNTGVISGTVGPQLDSSAEFNIAIHATDGTVDGDLLFRWHVGQAAANVVQLFDPASGGTLTLTSPAGTTLTADVDTESNYYDSANVQNFPLGYLRMSVQGVAPGGAANVDLHSSTPVNPADYYVFSPTAANSDYHWYDFLYQHSTDSDDAHTTGAEFLPDGDILLHLVDGGRGDADLAADGTITFNADGPAALALSAHIVGAPSTWPAGVPLTLASEIGGSAAPGASLQWQGYYTSDFNNYFNLPDGTDSTYTFTPPESAYYYVTLTATSADGSVTATDYSYHLNVPSTTVGTEPIGAFTIGGIPSDIVAGHAITATILADDASGNPLDGYTGPISVEITDSHNNALYSTSGNFDPSQFILGPITLNTASSSPTTETITITAGSTTVSLPIVVHPVSRFVPLENPPTVAEQTPFSLSFAAEDDRGVFDATYSGSAKLVYTDQQGQHDLSGGFQTLSDGVVTFENIVLPSGGVYSVQAISADGNIAGTTFVVSQGTAVDNTPPGSSVSPLPVYETSGNFTVAWSGADDANGSGIASYDVYVSDNGGPYTLFQSHTAATSATFSGQDGHSYAFYSIATDNAGNVEQTPAVADATTLIDLTAPTSAITPVSPVQQSTSVALAWSGGDGANGSGIAGFDIYVSDNSGAYTLWKHESAATTSDTFVGTPGHSYQFYSRATDNAGNVELAPDTADASTSIEGTALTSSVAALPQYETSTSFTVSWSGTDAGGPGIATYSVYVSTNGGAYTAFQTDTTQTSATFTGANGDTYSFYSIATDKVGNVETPHTTADASTLIQVIEQTHVQVASDHPTGSTYGQSVQFTATVGAATGTPTGSIQFQIDGADVGTPVTLVGSSASFTTSQLTASNHTITAVYTSDDPTFDNTEGDLPENVAPAPLTVTADNKTKNTGAVNPPLTVTITGFVNGDTSSVVTGAASLSTVATTTSGVGNYIITVGPGTLSAPNYTFAFVDGTLTIVAGENTPILTLVHDSAASATEGSSVTLTNTLLETTDSDGSVAASAIVYTITAAPTLGTLADKGNPLATGGSFSQQDIDDGVITYQSNEEGGDSVAFSVASGAASPITGTLAVTASDPAVVAIGGFTYSATAGMLGAAQAVATFTDPGGAEALADYAVTIDWGDGTSSTNGTLSVDPNTHVFTVNGGHTYAQDGTFAVAVTITHETATTVTSTASITSATLTGEGGIVASGVAVSGYEFGALAGVTVATFTDTNVSLSASDFSALIDWGDGTTSAGSVMLASGTYAVTGSHEYLDEGHYAIKVSIEQTAGPVTGGTSAQAGAVASIHEQLLADGTVGTPDQNYIQEIYRDLFGRQSEMQGLNYWVAELTQGVPRQQVAFQMVKIASFEEFQHDTVAALYEQYLGRVPDSGGLAYWSAYLYDGGTIEGMSQALVSSQEYWQSRGGGTAEGFLNALFRDALGRQIEPAALTYFESLVAEGASAAEIAEVVFASDEYHRLRVNSLFEQFLDRPADAGALAYFAGELDHGERDEIPISQLLSSDEYYEHAQV
jgi:hypothetical protein